MRRVRDEIVRNELHLRWPTVRQLCCTWILNLTNHFCFIARGIVEAHRARCEVAKTQIERLNLFQQQQRVHNGDRPIQCGEIG